MGTPRNTDKVSMTAPDLQATGEVRQHQVMVVVNLQGHLQPLVDTADSSHLDHLRRLMATAGDLHQARHQHLEAIVQNLRVALHQPPVVTAEILLQNQYQEATDMPGESLR